MELQLTKTPFLNAAALSNGRRTQDSISNLIKCGIHHRWGFYLFIFFPPWQSENDLYPIKACSSAEVSAFYEDVSSIKRSIKAGPFACYSSVIFPGLQGVWRGFDVNTVVLINSSVTAFSFD
ncbi:hypothetical protein CEXT_803841 [Caerostris extrusa]|uniref:Uncharacterized protein n=1 Tax=Caerostris extrusa TaxID=172846 RepID=A0AAV4Y0B9_CAEEX|nr:hypothetical protein CEXT_803841 [Caerostris extrusa]